MKPSLIAAVALATTLAAGAAPALADGPATFGLSVGAPGAFGSFMPGLAADYTTTTTVLVSSSAGNATLTIADASGAGIPGHLLNADDGHSLPSAVQASGSSTDPSATGSPLAPIGATPLTLITYGAPLTGPGNADVATIGLSQHIGLDDPLYSGTYAKTFVLTLQTTSP